MSWAVIAIVAGAVGAALSAGSFFAFSNFVMPALADLQPSQGAAAMQSINRFAPSPLFVGAIFGSGLVGIPVAISEWGQWDDGRFRWLLAGIVLSLLSAIITMAFNVPRNNALDALDVLDATASSTEREWLGYVTGWTRWNTARTITSAASVATYALSMRGR